MNSTLTPEHAVAPLPLFPSSRSYPFACRSCGRLGIGQIPEGPVSRHFVVSRLELHEHRPGFHEVVVLSADFVRRTCDPGANRIDICISLGVIGCFAHGIQSSSRCDIGEAQRQCRVGLVDFTRAMELLGLAACDPLDSV